MRFSSTHFAFTITIAALLTGCDGTSDRYKTPNADEKGVQFIGNSYFDFMGYIPKDLIVKSGKVYMDRSRSGATLTQITTDYEKALAEADKPEASYEIRTLLLEGGGNDVRKVCKTADQGAGFDGTFAGLSQPCKKALSGATTAAKALIDRTRDDKIENVVWLGPYYLAPDVVPPVLIDTFADAIKRHCETARAADARNNCHFVETRGAWTPAQADGYVLGDRAHVNEQGGQIIADLLWQGMVNADVYR